jgi:hypothetical protein
VTLGRSAPAVADARVRHRHLPQREKRRKLVAMALQLGVVRDRDH